MPLTSARLTELRTRAEAYLLDTCEIDYPTYTSDGEGGWTTEWTARGTAVACYLEAKTQADVGPTGEVLHTFTEYTLHIDAAGTVVEGDRVIHDSKNYAVEGILTGKTRRAYKSAKLTLGA